MKKLIKKQAIILTQLSKIAAKQRNHKTLKALMLAITAFVDSIKHTK